MIDKTSTFAEKNPLIPWLMWLLAALFYAYEFLLQVSPGVMAADLMRTFHVTAATIGNFGGIYFYAYMIMQIPVGILLDRFGARRLLTVAAGLCTLGSLLFSMANHFDMVEMGRFLIGIGSASAAVSCLYIAATWLPPKRFALLTGLLLSMGMLGAFSGEAPLALMLEHFNWRQVMLILTGVGGVLTLLIALIVRDRPVSSEDQQQHQVFDTHFFAGIRHVLKNKPSWIISIYAGLMFASTPTLGGLWGTPFLMQFYHLSRPMAATLISMLFVGWILGGPFFGWLSDRIQRRKPPLIIGSIGTLISLSSVIYLPGLPIWMMASLLFLFGFFSSGFLPAFSLIKENNPPETHGVAMGFMNTLNTLGVAIAQPLIGIALDYYWQGQMQQGQAIYHISSYHHVLMILPIFVATSLLLLPFIKETYCQSVVNIKTQPK